VTGVETEPDRHVDVGRHQFADRREFLKSTAQLTTGACGVFEEDLELGATGQNRSPSPLSIAHIVSSNMHR
jgi:hypothetical protein